MKFKITSKQYIKITPEPVPEGYCEVCAQCDIDYVDEDLGLNIRFGRTEADSFYGSFGCKNLDDLLNNKLFFDTEKRRDPGFEYNQWGQDIIHSTDVIKKYYFVSNTHAGILPYYMSWFYNDKDGNIVFEISPFYPWLEVDDAENQPGFIPYKEWIKNYQVTIRKIIPKETLIVWDNQARLYNHWKHD